VYYTLKRHKTGIVHSPLVLNVVG